MNLFKKLFYLSMLFLACACGIKQETASPRTPGIFNPSQFKQGTIYTISPERSEIKIFAYRGGALAALGHNHTIVSKHIQGKIYRHPIFTESGFEFKFPVNKLMIDEPEHREAAGENFSSKPSSKDIEGTRNNMLGEKLLNAKLFPDIYIHSTVLREAPSLQSHIQIRIKNFSCELTIPIELHESTSEILVKGTTELSQTQCGLTPFSILMGAIAVKDVLKIEFKITGIESVHLGSDISLNKYLGMRYISKQ